jgi:hypothetical protein
VSRATAAASLACSLDQAGHPATRARTAAATAASLRKVPSEACPTTSRKTAARRLVEAHAVVRLLEDAADGKGVQRWATPCRSRLDEPPRPGMVGE